MKAGADRLGLNLVIDKEETDHKGRCVFTLKPHGVKCLDARLNPLAPGAPTPRPMIEAVAKHAAQATTLDVPPHGTKLEVKTRQPQGGTAEDPERIARTAEERRANFKRAVEVVDEIIAKGILRKPFPDYILSSVTYKDEAVRGSDGLAILGRSFPGSNPAINERRIEIYKGGAVSLRVAIETYAHEIGHFHPKWNDRHNQHRLADVYGREAYKAYLQHYLKR